MEIEENDFEYETPEEDDAGDWRRPTKRKVDTILNAESTSMYIDRNVYRSLMQNFV